MAMISGLKPTCSGIILPKLPVQIQRCNGSRFKNYNAIPLVSKVVSGERIQYFLHEGSVTKYTVSIGRNHHELSFDDEFPKEPFWSIMIKEAFWALKSLFAFLAEQPGQLKYIEWPSFSSTLKTAALTLVLVGLLLVALSTVDSALCFLLAFVLRRTP